MTTYLTASPASLLAAWKDTEHKWINAVLREDIPVHSLRPEYKTALDRIPALMDEATVATADDLVVYRGAHLPLPLPLLTRSRLRFQDPGYMATSLSERTARRFATPGFSSRGVSVLFRITIPKGSPIIPVDELVNNFYTGHEQEIILPRNTVLRLQPWKNLLRRRQNGIVIVDAKVGLQ